MVTLLVLWAAAAAAEPPMSVRVVEARKACAAGRVDEGVEILAGIIAETGDLNALYNQGRCFQLNGRPEPAIGRFREYLRMAHDISADERQRVEGFIRELQADLDAQARRDEAARAPAVPLQLAMPMPARNEPTSKSLRVGSIVLGASSAAALFAGIYYSLQMRDISDDLESQWSLTATQFNSRWADGKRAELLARLSYGIAVAAAAGSASCYLLGRRAADRERRMALTPVVLAGGAGGSLRVGF